MAMTTIDMARAMDPGFKRAYDARMLQDVTRALVKSRNIVCLNGAGISTSAGIPDFRSKAGLYALAEAGDLLSKPSASPSRSHKAAQGSVFQSTCSSRASEATKELKGIDYFSSTVLQDSTTASRFYQFISALHSLSSRAEPTPTHAFIELLDRKGKLRRCYTQNIDGLEERAGLKAMKRVQVGTARGLDNGNKRKRKTDDDDVDDDDDYGPSTSTTRQKSKTRTKTVLTGNLVHLHGRLGHMRCTVCSHTSPLTKSVVKGYYAKGNAPACMECKDNHAIRSVLGKRVNCLKVGRMRPDITLYGESGKEDALIAEVQEMDSPSLSATSGGKGKIDCLLVLGTSLKVHGFKLLLKGFARQVQDRGGKVIYINLTPPSKEWSGMFDYHLQGTTDDFSTRITEDWKKMRPQDFETQTLLTKDSTAFTTSKDVEKEKSVTVSFRRTISVVKASKGQTASKSESQGGNQTGDHKSSTSPPRPQKQPLEFQQVLMSESNPKRRKVQPDTSFVNENVKVASKPSSQSKGTRQSPRRKGYTESIHDSEEPPELDSDRSMSSDEEEEVCTPKTRRISSSVTVKASRSPSSPTRRTSNSTPIVEIKSSTNDKPSRYERPLLPSFKRRTDLLV